MDQLTPHNQPGIEARIQQLKEQHKPSYEALEIKVAQLLKKGKNRKMALEALSKSHCENKRLMLLWREEADFWENEFLNCFARLNEQNQAEEAKRHNTSKKAWWKFWKRG